MKLEYAREKSDRIAKRDGTYVPKAKRTKLAPPPATADAGNPTITSESAAPAGEQNPADPSQLTATTTTTITSTEPAEQPSNILFARDLPDECNEMMLAMLFRQYAGFKEVRMPRPGLAFIEYQDEAHATLALKGLNGFNLTTTDTLKLTYGKA